MSDSPGLTPTAAPERIALLDVTRGVALLGILLANLVSFFGVYDMSPGERGAQPWAAAGDVVVIAVDWLVEGKFYSLFSLLLGVGFWLQRRRSEAAGGRPVERFFRRRMLLLAGVGLLHMVFVWYGDILLLYGLMGLALPSLARLSPRRQLRVAVVVLCVPLLTHVIIAAAGGRLDPRRPFREAAQALLEGTGYAGTATADMRDGGTWRAVFTANVAGAVQRPGAYLEQGRPAKVLGLFLLGAWLGSQVLPRLRERRRGLRAALLVGGVVGLAGSALYALIKQGTGAWFLPGSLGLLQTAAYAAGTTPLALAYAAALALSWERWAEPLQRAFAPLGRMALTVYLSQSVIQVLVFHGYGLGLSRRVPLALLPALALAILLVQRRACVWWLGRFAHGPVEWAWRRLAYRTAG